MRIRHRAGRASRAGKDVHEHRRGVSCERLQLTLAIDNSQPPLPFRIGIAGKQATIVEKALRQQQPRLSDQHRGGRRRGRDAVNDALRRQRWVLRTALVVRWPGQVQPKTR